MIVHLCGVLEICCDPADPVAFFQHLLLRYRAVLISFAHPRPPEVEESCIQPPLGHYKVNFDESVPQIYAGIGLGAVVRDWTGSVVAWRRTKIPHISLSGNSGVLCNQVSYSISETVTRNVVLNRHVYCVGGADSVSIDPDLLVEVWL